MKRTQTTLVGSTVWTSRRLLVWTTEYLAKKGVDQSRMASEMMLAHVLGVERLKLYMDPDRPANDLEKAAFHELVERAAQHEPVDYLVGATSFFAMMLNVTKDVLVPRPSTETLVEHVVQHARRTPGFHSPLIADIGTGSGAIAVALAKHVPNCHIMATDVCKKALRVAQANSLKHNVDDRIDFRLGNLLEPLAKQRVHYLTSNPPYISDDQWTRVPRNVKNYEPVGALRGGVDGLKYIRLIIEQAPTCLEKPGQLVLEIDHTQKQSVLNLVHQTAGLNHEHILADHEGLARVLVADRC